MHELRCKTATLLLAVATASATLAHSQSAEAQNPKWDFGIWAGGATGEEATNSFSEAQILTGGFYVGRVITGELGNHWYRGRFEYGFDVAPLFVQFQPQRIEGTAFDPLIFRWHSSPRGGAITPFLELSGGAVHTTANFPAGDTSTFNFITRGGGGLLVVVLSRVGVAEQVVGAGGLWVELDRLLEFRLGLLEVAVAQGGGPEGVVGAEIAGGYLGETDLQLARLGIVARVPRRDPPLTPATAAI